MLCEGPPLALGQGLGLAEVPPALVAQHRVLRGPSSPLGGLLHTTVTTGALAYTGHRVRGQAGRQAHRHRHRGTEGKQVGDQARGRPRRGFRLQRQVAECRVAVWVCRAWLQSVFVWGCISLHDVTVSAHCLYYTRQHHTTLKDPEGRCTAACSGYPADQCQYCTVCPIVTQ